MNSNRQRWVWAVITIAISFHCQGAPQTDPFLVLGSPTLTGDQVEFTLTGEAEVSYVIEASSNAQSWLPVTTNTSPAITRQITLNTTTNDTTFYRAWREPLPLFPGAVVARSNITFNGNSITVDSYDSGDTNHSTTNGLYDPTTRKAGGDVLSALGFDAVNNTIIKGKLITGAFANYSIGPTGSVGGLNWTGPGIQPGWYYNNFHWALPDVPAPYTTALPPSGQGTNLWYLGGNGSYIFNGNFAATVTKTIYVAGNATMFVTGTFDCRGKIIVAPGASLKLFVGGANTRLNEVLTDGHPTSFQYYGLPANVLIAWTGNDEYVGTIYAPQASVRLGGGGSDAYDFMGACACESVIINGHFNFHYDENLKRARPKR